MIMWYLLEINTHPPWSISVAGIHFAHQHSISAVLESSGSCLEAQTWASNLFRLFWAESLRDQQGNAIYSPTYIDDYRWVSIICIQVTPYTIVLSQILPTQLSGICKGKSSTYQQSLPNATRQKACDSILGSMWLVDQAVPF